MSKAMKFSRAHFLQWDTGRKTSVGWPVYGMAVFSVVERGVVWCESTEHGGQFMKRPEAEQLVGQLTAQGAEWVKATRKPTNSQILSTLRRNK